jgi:ribose/xylose/arabinose/galactoside ABC-type transport system permease subunit
MIMEATIKDLKVKSIYKKLVSSPDASSLITVSTALLGLILFFSFSSPYFFSKTVFLNIGMYAAIMGTLACSMTFINVSGNIDISGGSQIAVVGMVTAVLIKSGSMPLWLCVLLGVASGTVCGMINGFFITVIKVNAFITTIATMQMLRGIAYLISNGQTLVISDQKFKFLGRGYVSGIPFTLIMLVVFYIVFHIISRNTVFGRTIYMIGGNPLASFLSGIRVQRIKFILYTLNGTMAGCAGIMLASQSGAGLPMAAMNSNMQALSAVILGGAGLSGGRGTILGTFIGVMVLCTLITGMTMLSISSFWQDVIVGVVLLISVSIDAIKSGSLKRKI